MLFNYTNLFFKVGTHMKKHFVKSELYKLWRMTTLRTEANPLPCSYPLFLIYCFNTGRCSTPGAGETDYTKASSNNPELSALQTNVKQVM